MSGPPPFALRSRAVVTPEGVRPARVRVVEGTIASVEPIAGAPSGARPRGGPRRADEAGEVDLGDTALLPGVVDTHVHVNEPGRTDWEGFGPASAAAASGGVTTIVDMPLNSDPVTTSVEALEAKRRAAARDCAVDHGFWGGAVPGNVRALEPLWAAGVLGFKCFLTDSGISDFPPLDREALNETMRVVARLGAPLLVHAEAADRLRPPPEPADPGRAAYGRYVESRPEAAEVTAVERVIAAARATGARIHVVHVSSRGALERLAAARADGIAVTAETCPHYLTFAAEEIPDGATLFKCAPPIRAGRHREALWEGLARGTLDLVASDHSPCPPALRHLEAGDFFAAWGGIASLELSLLATWTGARRRGHDLARVAAWLAEAPARLAGLEGRKGRIAPGHDADLVVFDSEGETRVRAQRLRSRHPRTPYEGRTLAGSVLRTYVRGRIVFDGGRALDGAHDAPRGPKVPPRRRPGAGGRWLRRRAGRARAPASR